MAMYEVQLIGTAKPVPAVTYDEARKVANVFTAQTGNVAKVWRVSDDKLMYRTGRKSDERI